MKGYDTMTIMMMTDLSFNSEDFPLKENYELNLFSILMNANLFAGEYLKDYELKRIDFKREERRIEVLFEK